jgi:hypothetical protein
LTLIQTLSGTAVLVCSFAIAASASTLDISFTGEGSGTISGNTNATFTDQDFSVTFVEDTTDVVGGGGFFLYNPAGNGTFTEGSYDATFNNAIIETNGNGPGPGAYETALLFNSDFGSALDISESPALLGYALVTAVTTGSIPSSSAFPSANISAYQDALGFTTTGGDTVEFTSLDSLDFTASVPSTGAVPEPSMLFFVLPALLAFVLVRRMRSAA